MIKLRYHEVKITTQVRKIKDAEGIYLTVTGFPFKPGRLMLKKFVTQERYIDFLLYVATELVATVVNAIDNQRYKHKWKPLSISYCPDCRHPAD